MDAAKTVVATFSTVQNEVIRKTYLPVVQK